MKHYENLVHILSCIAFNNVAQEAGVSLKLKQLLSVFLTGLQD